MRPPGVPPVPPPVHDDEVVSQTSASPGNPSAGNRPGRFRLGRRRLLVGAAASGLFVAGGGLLWKFGGLGSQVPAPGLSALSVADRDTIEAIAEIFFPGEDDLPSGRDVKVVEAFDAYVASLPGQLSMLMRLLIQGIEWGAVLSTSRFERFSRLPFDVRREVLDAWESSEIYARRSGFLSLKLAMGMSYYEDDSVRSAIGWYVPCLDPSVDGAGEEWL